MAAMTSELGAPQLSMTGTSPSVTHAQTSSNAKSFSRAPLGSLLALTFAIGISFLSHATETLAWSISLSKTPDVMLGQTQTVSWSGFTAPAKVTVYKSSTPWVDATTTGPASGSQGLVTTGWEERSDYKVCINGASNCSSTFAVGHLTVVSPNSGEYWNPGSSKTATWTSAAVTSSIGIDLYKGAANQARLATVSNSGIASITVPTTVPTGCDYRIAVSTSSSNIYDFGDGYFCIASITVTSPNGGETLYLSETWTVSWQSSNVTSSITIDLLKGGSVYTRLTSSASNSGGYAWTPSGLPEACDYSVGVSAQSGNIWDYSNSTFCIRSRVLPPPQLTSPIGGVTVWVATDPGPVPLRWSAVGSNGYLLQIDTLAPMAMSANQYDPSLGVGAYTWKVCTKNASQVCGSYSAPESFTVVLNTLPPPQLTSPIGGATVWVATDPGSVPLRWSAVGSNGYLLQIDTLAPMAMSANQYDPWLGVGAHAWKVCTKNASQVCGSYSAPESFTVAGPPLAPSSLTAGAVSSTQISLGWTDNSKNEAGFKIERKLGSGGAFAQIAVQGANLNFFNDTTVTTAQQYCYRVRATNTAGDSGYSNEACVNATGSQEVIWITPPPTSIVAGQTFPVSWVVAGANSFDANVHWDPTDPGGPGNPSGNISTNCVSTSTSCSSNHATGKTSETLTAPSQGPAGFPVVLKYRVQVRIPAGGTTSIFSDIRSVTVSPNTTAPCGISCSAAVPASATVNAPVSFSSTATASNCSGGPSYAWSSATVQPRRQRAQRTPTREPAPTDGR